MCPVDGAIGQVGGRQLAAEFEVGRDHLGPGLPPHSLRLVVVPGAHDLYVPGDLFSVNPATARGVPGLFARNEQWPVCIVPKPLVPHC